MPRGASLLVLVIALLASQVFMIPPQSVSSQQITTSVQSYLTSTTSLGTNQTNQATAPACLAPSRTDISTTVVPPSSVNATIPGNVLSDVRLGKASLISPVQLTFLLRLELVFKIHNQDSFNRCLAAISDPSSPYYRNFLNATTLQSYVETPGQKSSIMNYLAAKGLNVTQGASPLVLQVVGDVRTVEAALGVHVNLYRGGNRTFFATDSDPSMPQDYAELIGAVEGLDNFTTITHLNTVPGPCTGPYCAQAIQVGYSLTGLYSNGFNGNGVKVAVVDLPGDPNPSQALAQYDLQYGLQAPGSMQVLCGDATTWLACSTSVQYDAGWASEAAMDIEAVHAAAPGAGIALFYAAASDSLSVLDAIDYAASTQTAQIVSNSWAYGPDTFLTSSFLASVDSRFAVDVAQGLTILFASGDSGVDGGTEFPASDPNVLAVGATNLILTGCGTVTCTGYGSETGAYISGGGYSGAFAEPTWQTTSIGPSPSGFGGHGRAVPDVSMLGYSPGFWVYSTWSDACGSFAQTNQWFGCAGTSLSTPLWAGFLATAVQAKGGSGFGNISPLLYQLGVSQSYASIFHDVTSGSNGLSAGPGWDAVTGWGTPVGDSLVTALNNGGASGSSIIVMTVSYSLVGGGTATAPTFHYIEGGASKSATLKTTPVTIVVDADSAWSVTPNPLVGSTTSQRWQADPSTLSGIASSSTTITFAYYHQYPFKLSYSTLGGALGSTAPTLNAQQYGVATSQVLTNVATTYWVDAGSAWSVSNPLPGSSVSERWWSTQAVVGTAAGAKTVAFVYQHQYYLTMMSNSTTEGTVTPSSGWRNAASLVSINESPKSGYVFVGWSGTGSGSYSGKTSYVTIKMNGPITEIGMFALRTLIVSLVSPSNGQTFSPGATVTLKVQVIVSGSAVAGANVAIYVNGTQAVGCAGTTNTYGYFSCTFKTQPGMTYIWNAWAWKAGFQLGKSATRTFKSSLTVASG